MCANPDIDPMVIPAKVHLRLAIVATREFELAWRGVGQTITGVTLGNLIQLCSVMLSRITPAWRHFDYAETPLDECIRGLHRQHPKLGELDLSRVTAENFETWLKEQEKVFGGAYLPIKPVNSY